MDARAAHSDAPRVARERPRCERARSTGVTSIEPHARARARRARRWRRRARAVNTNRIYRIYRARRRATARTREGEDGAARRAMVRERSVCVARALANGKGVDARAMIARCPFVFITDDAREARAGTFERTDWRGIAII